MNQKLNSENYYLIQLNSEDDIKPNTGNCGWHLPLLSKNIAWSSGDRVNKLDPEEVTSSPHKSSYQKQRCKEVITRYKNIAKVIVVDGHNLKFTVGKDI